MKQHQLGLADHSPVMNQDSVGPGARFGKAQCILESGLYKDAFKT